MGLADTQAPARLTTTAQAEPVCRCGHCRAVIDIPKRRRVRCQSCGWWNAIPARVHVTCERCKHSQHMRFSRRNSQLLCTNCAHALRIREIELVPLRRNNRRRALDRRRVSRRERVLLTILLYSIVLLFFLFWFTRQ